MRRSLPRPRWHEVIAVMKKACAVLALALLAGCGNDVPPPDPVRTPAPPPPPPAKQLPPKPAMAPPLSAAAKTEMDATFNEARAKVKQAREFKKQGDGLLKANGAAAANDTYVKAKELYHQAVDMTEVWIEPEISPPKVTAAQVHDYLESYNSERGRWIQEMAELGKVHKDD